MSIKIITISREYGSGGRAIGQQVAEQLGWAFYDKELIARAAEETGFAESFIKKYGEQRSMSNFLSLPFSGMTFNGMSAEDYLWSIQRKIIRELADEGPCVIVGRCSDYILKDRRDALHIFVHGNDLDKIKRIQNVYHDTPDNPVKRLAEVDRSRSRNYRYYTDREWGASSNYSLCLNSSLFGVDGCTDIIVELAKRVKSVRTAEED
ncbi:MAG: cytidylate kinase-like family protein [Firmicutes bacterium]|nr:cytidylate kinase-like family protein [Bacillota bacterium]